MLMLNGLQAALLGILLVVLAVLLTIWWRQQSLRWPLVLFALVPLAPFLSLWSGLVFQVDDYRAGCDGICPGFSGAPVAVYRSDIQSREFLPGMFLVNSLVYLVLLLAWSAVLRGMLARPTSGSVQRSWGSGILGACLAIAPLALGPVYLPPPEAQVRGDPQRISINAQREVYLYDQLAPAPVLRVGVEDVRPRPDEQPGMRVCLRMYTFFYIPIGHMYLDMAPQGVHSTSGGVLPLEASCWD